MQHGVRPVRLALGGLIALAAAIGIGRFIYTPILPLMAEGLGLSKSEAGLIASANFVGYLIGAMAAATPRLPLQQRTALIAALTTSALTTGAMALPGDMTSFILLRLIGGAASAFTLVLASALVLERLADAGASRLSAVHFSGVGTGITVSALLTPALASAGLDWRMMWLGGGSISMAAVIAVWALVTDAPPRSRLAPANSEGTSRNLVPLAFAYGLFGFGYVITATFIVAIVRASPAARSIEPVYWLVLGLAAVPSVALWTAVGRRIGVLRAFAVACIAEAVGVAASVVSSGIAALIVASALLGGTFMGITALGLIAGRSLPGTDPRRMLAILTAAFGVGQIVGPVVAGFGFDLTGSFLLPSLLAAAALGVAAALALLLHGAQRTT